MTWFQVWTVCWQVAVFLTPTLLGCAILWLRSQFVTKVEAAAEKNRIDGLIRGDQIQRDQRYEETKTKHSELRDGVRDIEGRLRVVEADVAKPPSRHALNNAIATMQGGLHAVERGVDDMRRQIEAQSADLHRQMETLNSYLHTVIEKHLG